MAESGLMPRDCVLFSTADWDTPYWTNKQHTARLLAEYGWRVLYVESVGIRPPRAGSSRDLARLWRRLRRGLGGLLLGPKAVREGVWVLSPLVIPFGHRSTVVQRFNRLLLHLAIEWAVRRAGFQRPLLWTYHPYMLSALEPLARSGLVYHCVDDIAAIPGVDAVAFEAAERDLLRQADVVFTTAPALQDHCAAQNDNCHLLPNVADEVHFGRALEPGPLPPDLAAIPAPRIGYHGVLSDFKVDFELLSDTARAHPEWHFVLIGEEREGQHSESVKQLCALENVHLIGYRAYAQLPDYLKGIDVGLLPTLINDYTRSMFPMKYYEYLAAGVPVVATPLDFTRDHAEPFLAVGASLEAFADAIGRQLLHGRMGRDAVVTGVGDNTWKARMERMLSLIDDAANGREWRNR
jgi:glycosyltransferase involved in cell wall biosynthesis